MTKFDEVSGVRLRFRLVQPDDADYIFGLRTDPRYNEHLSSVSGTAIDQRSWIEKYKYKEKLGEEFYFIIERLNDRQCCGVVRLYDICGGTFTWGSWILDQNKTRMAAFESAHLVYEIAFNRLELKQANFDVRLENVKVIDFHRRFGATEVRSDDLNAYFIYDRDVFLGVQEEQRRVLLSEEGSEG